MITLTLQQPFALAGVMGVKPWETRGKKTNFRGVHLIASSASWKDEYKQTLLQPSIYEATLGQEMHLGAVVGHATITDCVTTTEALEIMNKQVKDGVITQRAMDLAVALGDFSKGRYAYKWEDAKQYVKPIPIKGNLGFFDTRKQKGNYQCVDLENAIPEQKRHMLYLGQMLGNYGPDDATLWKTLEQMPVLYGRRMDEIETLLFCNPKNYWK